MIVRPLISLLTAVLVVAGLAGIAHARPLTAGSSAASLRQDAPYVDPDDVDGDEVPNAQDKCPTQPGSLRATGCPDTDNDGVVDSADQCPKVGGAAGDGCPSLHIGFNGYLPKVSFFAESGQDKPNVNGTATVEVSKAVARKLGLSSTRIASADFEHPCGHGVLCANVNPSAAITKKINAAEKRLGGDGARQVYVEAKVTFAMTAPRKETLSDTYRFGLGSNGGQYRVCGAGFSAAQNKGAFCGGKSSGGDGEG